MALNECYAGQHNSLFPGRVEALSPQLSTSFGKASNSSEEFYADNRWSARHDG